MNGSKLTIRVVTAAGTNASKVGDIYGAYDGVSWRHAVDNCDSDGQGRVFLDCDSEEIAHIVMGGLDQDEWVVSFDCN